MSGKCLPDSLPRASAGEYELAELGLCCVLGTHLTFSIAVCIALISNERACVVGKRPVLGGLVHCSIANASYLCKFLDVYGCW